MSTQSEVRPAVTGQVPGVREQRDQILSSPAQDTGRIAASWHAVADLLDELVADYEDHLEAGVAGPASTAAAMTLCRILDGFDVVSAAARRNSEVLDDLATEMTIAQARMATIWNELEAERLQTEHRGSAALERGYAARAAREAWYPLLADLAAAGRRLQILDPHD